MAKRKEKEEPGKVYQVRNVIDRENWITCGWTNKPTHGLLANILVCLQQLYGWLGGTTLHYYTTLHYLEVTTSYGKCTHPTFENYSNLLIYQANWLLYTPENCLQGGIKHQDNPFQALLKPSLHCCSKKLPEWAPTKTQLCVLWIAQLHPCAAWQSAYTQLSPLHLLSTSYVTRVINCSRLSPTFLYCKWQKDGQNLGTRLARCALFLQVCICVCSCSVVVLWDGREPVHGGCFQLCRHQSGANASSAWPPLPPLFSPNVPKRRTTTPNQNKKKHMRVGMEPSKTNQTKWEWHHNTFTKPCAILPSMQTLYMHNTLFTPAK